MGNAYFKHRSLHKYTRVARGEDRLEVKSMIDLVLVKKPGYAVIYAGCEGGQRDEMRPFRPTCTV